MSDDRGLLFDAVAEDYDRVRPGYPPCLVDRACAGLAECARVLEIGCGTGKLTRELAGRGFRLEAVDPGPAMIAVARRAVGDAPVTFHLGRFEDVELPQHAFDAAFSATAFHWVDPAVGWEKVARLLRAGGTFALLGHVGDTTGPVETELRAVWREVRPDARVWPARTMADLVAGVEERRADLSEVWAWLTNHRLAVPGTSKLFDDVRIETEPREVYETADEAFAHVRTTSTFLQLDSGRQQWLEQRFREIVDAAGGYRNTIYAVLVTARAVPASA